MKKFCIIAFPIQEAFNTPLSNLMRILCYFSSQVYSITAKDDTITLVTNNLKKVSDMPPHLNNMFFRVIRYAYMQFKIALIIFSIRNDVDTIIFFMEGGAVLPMTTEKILRKKIIWLIPSCIIKKDGNLNIFAKFVILLKDISYIITDKIILYSPILINEWTLTKFRHKISIGSEHFLNMEEFYIINSMKTKKQKIGYIGRLSEEKGIINFIKAIVIIKRKMDIKILICGDGHLKDQLLLYIDSHNLSDSIEFFGWIPHRKIPICLNELKLLVLPSYTEGLPNIMLEAMACGTSVLANPVGVIPCIIKDGETGFLMENNSPECIAANVIRALEHPDLEGIALRARALVEREFTFEKAVERWKKVLEDV